MSITVAYRDGVFEPLEKVEGAQPGAIDTAFSEDELRDFLETAYAAHQECELFQCARESSSRTTADAPQ